jgi:type IV pilus assembly protein PilQ
VKPRITDEGRISMEIKATNDVADYARGATLPGGNPPIRKNAVESTVVIQDGDTVVIGGVSRDQDETVTSGVPWFYKIPVLGWLFKYEQITKNKRQLLVFITPKILKSDGFVESAGKVIN